MNDLLLPVGTMIKPKPENEFLVLWSTDRNSNFDDEIGRVLEDEIMIILKSEKTNSENKSWTDEWKNGSYMVLSSSGLIGWVGEGWVIPI